MQFAKWQNNNFFFVRSKIKYEVHQTYIPNLGIFYTYTNYS